MPQVDFFNFFRWVLGTIVGIYATVVTLQSLYGWYIFLNSGDKYITMLRRYVIVHGLRLRFKSFWGDVLICIMLSVIFITIAYAHRVVEQIDQAVHPDIPAMHQKTAMGVENHGRRSI